MRLAQKENSKNGQIKRWHEGDTFGNRQRKSLLKVGRFRTERSRGNKIICCKAHKSGA